MTLAFTCCRPAQKSGSHPFIYEQEDIARFLRARNILVGTISHITRNSSGDELFVLPFPGISNRYEALRISTNGVGRIEIPSGKVFPPLNGRFCAWLAADGQAVNFQSGASIELPPFGLFDLDSSGRYFVIGEKPKRTWIARIESPQNQVLIAQDVLGASIFTKGRLIYVCGIAYSNSSFNRSPGSAVCLVLEDNGNQFSLKERHNFEWSAGIVDIDPYSDRLLLWDKSDAFPTVYVFDLTKNQRARVGRATGFEFFLRQDLLKK